jgi:chromosome segregation ATPase
MASKKGRPEPRWVVILEDIRSQNRTTLEAVGASQRALTERIDRFEERTDSRFDVVEAAIQSNTRGIAALDQRMESVEGRIGSAEGSLISLDGRMGSLEGSLGSLAGRMGSLDDRMGSLDDRMGSLESRLEKSDQENRLRFAALEAALHRLDQESRSRDASLELAIRDLKVSVQQNSVDIRELAGKVEALSRLEERVSALERRGA